MNKTTDLEPEEIIELEPGEKVHAMPGQEPRGTAEETRRQMNRLDKTAMKGNKWQYCAVEFPYNKIGAAVNGFNELGERGWELTAIIPGLGQHTAMFKRKAK